MAEFLITDQASLIKHQYVLHSILMFILRVISKNTGHPLASSLMTPEY